jgi:hypothetical protein
LFPGFGHHGALPNLGIARFGGSRTLQIRPGIMTIPRSPSRALASALPLLILLGCADARGRFEDFKARLSEVPDSGTDADSPDGADDGGPCAPPAPNAVGGPALLAIDTNLIPGKPILFLGVIDTPALDGTTAVHFVYHALDAMNRHDLVGPELEVGPYPLPDGYLTAPIAESTLDGRANPQLYGSPVTSAMTLRGQICGVRSFYCGTLDGTTTGLLSGPFTGHFGITLLSGPDAVPAQPRFGCDSADLADPLAPSGAQQ